MINKYIMYIKYNRRLTVKMRARARARVCVCVCVCVLRFDI